MKTSRAIVSFAFVASILLGALPAFAVPRLAVPPEGVAFGEIAAAEVASKSIALRQSTLAYDPANGRLATMLASGSETPFAWNYLDGSDLKSSLAYPNGLTASWAYDANGQLLQVRNVTPTNTISQYDYVYDAAGRRINVSKSGTAFDHDDLIAYSYNEKSELTNAIATADFNYRYAYDFDDIGNRETSSERGTGVTGSDLSATVDCHSRRSL